MKTVTLPIEEYDELTHCDEMNREPDFRQAFDNVICTDKAKV